MKASLQRQHSSRGGPAHPPLLPALRATPVMRRHFSDARIVHAPSFAWLVLLAAAAFCVVLVLQAIRAHACTSIIVGRGATEDGSTMTTHNNDCEDCDVRVGVVPAREHKEGSQAALYPSMFDFPRYVGSARGPLYEPAHLLVERLADYSPPLTQPLGHIRQVSHTLSYIDGSYGLMNSAGVSMGESTCGAKVAAFSVARGGQAKLDASALSRLALERCDTARCAVQLMGRLAEDEGYYGAEDPEETGSALFEVAGEALTVADGTEAWVFHVLPSDREGSSALWAAQRLAQGHVAVVPNKFVIDAMNLSDHENFLASEGIRRRAIELGFLEEGGEHDGGDDAFEFSRAFALDFDEGGNNSGEGERRRWRVFSIAAPSRDFKADQSERFPFSVEVEGPRWNLNQVTSLMRDHFEGTPFDQTRGLAAGPYGNPNRYDRNSAIQPEVVHGWFERSISLHRTSYSSVAVSHAEKPSVLWFAHHAPHNSLYLPLFAETLAVPASFGRGTLYHVDRLSAWWAFCSVANSADRMYAPIHAAIAERQRELEKDSQEKVRAAAKQAVEFQRAGKHDRAVQLLTDFTVAHNEGLVATWWNLLDELTATFRDGLKLQSSHPQLELEHIFYPVWWLKEVGYFDRGELVEPHYPVAPLPLNQPVPAAQSSLISANEELEGGGSVHSLLNPPTASAFENWWTNDRVRWLAIALFAFVLVLLSVVCFCLGSMFSGRHGGGLSGRHGYSSTNLSRGDREEQAMLRAGKHETNYDATGSVSRF